MFQRRRGSLLATSISLIAVFLTLTVGVIAFMENSMRMAKNERWGMLAAEAARSGLALVMGWAEANIDQYTKLPADWEMADGDVKDPIRGFIESPVGRTLNIKQASTSLYLDDPNLQPGMIVDKANSCEYVLGVYGKYVVSFKARIQSYRISENHPRQFKIGISGRVREKPGNKGGVALFPTLASDESYKILSERVLLATIGKEPFSKYAALIDIDLVKNWVPGEVVEGPVHINRGYWDQGATAADKRSKMVINSPGSFNTVPGALPATAVNHPVFTDTVTMAFDTTTAPADAGNGGTAVEINQGGLKAIGASNPTTSREIFTAAENQGLWNSNDGQGARAGPKPAGKIDMPRSSRARLSDSLGTPIDHDINTDYKWLQTQGNGYPDGLYIPTYGAMSDPTSPSPGYAYNPAVGGTGYAAGGIYIRGNVEVMRGAVNGNNSYYFFQLGYNHSHSRRRSYMVKVDRANKTILLKAFPMQQTLQTIFNAVAPNYDLSRIEQHGGNATATNPVAFSLGAAATTTAVQTLMPAPDSNYSKFPFNGVIFVDLSEWDPARTGPNPLEVSSTVAPTTGNIMALGNPGFMSNNAAQSNPYNKIPFKEVQQDNANVPTAQEGADFFSTVDADPASTDTPRAASKLNIITGGHIFIQNHLLLYSVPAADRMDPNRTKVTLQMTRDLLGLCADRQVLVGLCAPLPTSGQRQDVGTVIHAAIAALGDPLPSPGANTGNKVYRGSFSTEGMMQLFNPVGVEDEDYGVVWYGTPGVNASAATYPGAGVANKYSSNTADHFPSNPFYVQEDRTASYPNPDNTFGFQQLKYTAAAAGGLIPTRDPNVVSTRGRLLVFGSITVKKRGAVGVGNMSFDKDFRYDARLLSIAPPMFPTSTNMVLKSAQPIYRDDMAYLVGGAVKLGTGGKKNELKFMATRSK